MRIFDFRVVKHLDRHSTRSRNSSQSHINVSDHSDLTHALLQAIQKTSVKLNRLLQNSTVREHSQKKANKLSEQISEGTLVSNGKVNHSPSSLSANFGTKQHFDIHLITDNSDNKCAFVYYHS
jgi:hypothetical protein